MAENLSENAVMCNFQCFKRYGFNFAEKDWYFGKYKISYVAFIGIWIIAIKCWLTVYYKGIVTDSWSLTNFTLTFSTGLGAFIYLMKMMSFLWKNKIIYNLADLLKNDLIVIDIMDQRLKKDQTFCLKISKLVFRLNCVTFIFWGSYFICFGLLFQYSSFFYNYDDIPLPIFFLENVLDILCLIIISSFMMNTQTLPITAMVLLRSKLEVLCGEFKNLEYHSEEQFDETITKLVEYHESLLKIKQLINDVFVLPYFLELSTLSLLMASLVFYFSELSIVDDIYQFVMLLVGISFYALQVFWPCYYGNKVSTASDDLVFSLYSCPWYDMPVKARKSIIMFMDISQKTMYFGIAEFFRLTMEQFGTIVNSIYSVFTLLREFRQK